MHRISGQASARRAYSIRALLGAVVLSSAMAFACTAKADPVSVHAPKVPSFADVVQAVSPAVVSVRASNSGVSPGNGASGETSEAGTMSRLLNAFKNGGSATVGGGHGATPRPVAQGSGFFVSGDGYVVTNAHLVDEADGFSVILDDGSEMEARLIGSDARTDIALLKVEKPGRTFTYVGFASDDSVRIGDWVVSVGNPYGLGGTVTAGIVSARGRDLGAGPYDDFIQVDSVVNRGDPGGPAFNLGGKVIGVDTTMFSPSDGSAGVAFAVPASTVQDVVADLMRHGTVERGWLGVQIQPVTKEIAESVGLPKPQGAMIADLDPDTPAKKAGLDAGDVITSLDGKPVQNASDLARRVAGMKPGTSVALGLWHDGKAETMSVELGRMPGGDDDAAAAGAVPAKPEVTGHGPLARFGLTVVPAEGGKGALVTNVDPLSSADRRGLRPGDVIVSVNGTDVRSATDILKAISAAAGKHRKAALFRIENNRQGRFVALPIDLG